MKASVLRIISVCLLSSTALAGCGPAGLGRIPRPGEHKEPELYVPVLRNNGEHLTIKSRQKPGSGAIHRDGTVELKAGVLSANGS